MPTDAPAVSPEFWLNGSIQTALAERHFGHLLRAYRRHPAFRPEVGSRGISQEQLGAWLSLTQPQESRLETGPPCYDLYRMRRWAALLRIPNTLLWFDLEEEAP